MNNLFNDNPIDNHYLAYFRKSFMKKRIGFILIIIGVVVGADLLVGAVTGKLIREVPDVGVNQTNTAQALFSRTADILILGSSRANHSFDCKVLEDSLGLSCYNAGRDGQNMVYDAMVFFSYIERHVPKLVILDIVDSQLSNRWFNNLKEMNCYYGLSKSLDRIVDENTTWMEKLKLKSNLYRYNNTLQWLLNAHIADNQSERDGYRPMPVNTRTTFKASIHESEYVNINKRCFYYLEEIRKACDDNHIQLILTYTPSLVVVKNNGLEDWIDAYAKKNNIKYYDFGREAVFYEHPELFYDMTHLNAIGAQVFTTKIVQYLK